MQLASVDGISVVAKNNLNIKVLLDGKMSSGTIIFEENTIDDYDYYEFIFGLEYSFFSQIVSKEYLKYPLKNGDNLVIGVAESSEAVVGITITNVTDNSIDILQVSASGNSWNGRLAYI